MNKLVAILIICLSTDLSAMDELYKLLKVRNTFQISDFKKIIEFTKKEYEVLPYITIKRSFSSQDKKPNDEIDEYLKSLPGWEKVVFLKSLDETLLSNSDSDTIRFLRAKKLFSEGSYKSAIQEIRSMNKSSTVYSRSLYLLGLMFLYNNQYNASVDSFKGCVRMLDKLNESADTMNKEMNLFIKDKCQIAISRVLFKEKKFEESKKAYKAIPLQSYQWPESLLELAWIYYMEDESPKSFARNLTLENKSFFKFMFIENRLLAILNLRKNCFYKQALDLTTKTVDEFNLVLKDLSKYSELDDKNRWKLFEKDISSTPFVVIRKKIIKQIDNDLKKIDKLPQTIVKTTFVQELRKIRKEIATDVNLFVKKLLKRKYLSISRNVEDLLAIKLSIINKLKLEDSSKTKVKKRKKGKNEVRWQFNNEYWPDELEDVSINLGNRCT